MSISGKSYNSASSYKLMEEIMIQYVTAINFIYHIYHSLWSDCMVWMHFIVVH